MAERYSPDLEARRRAAERYLGIPLSELSAKGAAQHRDRIERSAGGYWALRDKVRAEDQEALRLRAVIRALGDRIVAANLEGEARAESHPDPMRYYLGLPDDYPINPKLLRKVAHQLEGEGKEDYGHRTRFRPEPYRQSAMVREASGQMENAALMLDDFEGALAHQAPRSWGPERGGAGSRAAAAEALLGIGVRRPGQSIQDFKREKAAGRADNGGE